MTKLFLNKNGAVSEAPASSPSLLDEVDLAEQEVRRDAWRVASRRATGAPLKAGELTAALRGSGAAAFSDLVALERARARFQKGVKNLDELVAVQAAALEKHAAAEEARRKSPAPPGSGFEAKRRALDLEEEYAKATRELRDASVALSLARSASMSAERIANGIEKWIETGDAAHLSAIVRDGGLVHAGDRQ